MKIKEIYVEAKKSKKFQTYSVGLTAELDDKDDVIVCRKKLQKEVREAVLEEISKDEPEVKNPYLN